MPLLMELEDESDSSSDDSSYEDFSDYSEIVEQLFPDENTQENSQALNNFHFYHSAVPCSESNLKSCTAITLQAKSTCVRCHNGITYPD